MEGLQFSNSYIPFRENPIWDTFLISSNSCLRMYVPPMTRIHALTVSFSKGWLYNNVLGNNEAFEYLRQKIDTSEKLTLSEYMHASERKMITELIDDSMRKPRGSFFITSAVLKIISDFFDKIKKREIASDQNISLDDVLMEIEKLLSSPATAKMPNLESLACKYGFSESALKRQFRQRFDTSLSAYFTRRRMDYAMQLICEQKMNLTDAAHLLGYKNVNHFIAMFKKYFNAKHGPQVTA
jgi:AraC-like DNA-binding protein